MSQQAFADLPQHRELVRVRPRGALDLATAAPLHEQIDALREAGFGHLVLDLGGLDFMDCTGLRLTRRLAAEACRDGVSIVFVPGIPRVQRVFDVTGAAATLPFASPA